MIENNVKPEKRIEFLVSKENVLKLKGIVLQTGLTLTGLILFMLVWSVLASQVNTSLGKFPGPVQVFEQGNNLWDEHLAIRERKRQFYQRQHLRNTERLEADPDYEVTIRSYTGAPAFVDQIATSLLTVLSGFLLASLIAIPSGIAIGLSKTLHSLTNPLIQLFKPISPLAWLPLVTMVVSAIYISESPMLEKSFVISMITVTLCSLWPTIINTAVGVSSVSPDLNNVSKVLRLTWFTHIRKIVLPASVPMIFTGLRLSLGVAWMVLIAAEMLSQNPGLGKFVWDEFQNGSSASLSRIMVAVLTIGIIGFLLDRAILLLQVRFSWDKKISVR